MAAEVFEAVEAAWIASVIGNVFVEGMMEVLRDSAKY